LALVLAADMTPQQNDEVIDAMQRTVCLYVGQAFASVKPMGRFYTTRRW
jgi:hypothetical protein